MASSVVVGNLKAILSLDTTNFDKGATASEANAKKLADRLQKDLVPSQSKINALIRDFAGNQDIKRALEFATAIEKVGGASKLTAAEQARTNRVVQEAISKYRALGLEAPKNLTSLAAATASAQTPTKALNTSMTTLLSTARSVAGLFGVTLGAGALVGFASSVFNAADQVGDLAQKMGVSTDAAQRFQFAARQSGAEIENVSQAIVTMNKNLAEGDKSTVGALSAVGLKFQNVRAMKPEDAFRTIADAIGKIPDPMLQAQVAMELFGKAGAEILPMIREESLKAADGIQVMSEDTIKALKDAKQAWENFWNDLVIISGPVIVEISKQLRKMIDDLRVGLSFLGALAIGGVNPFEAARAASAANRAGNRGRTSTTGDMSAQDFFELSAFGGSYGLASSGPTRFESKEEREAREKRQAEHAKRMKAILDDFTGADTRQRLRDLVDSLSGVRIDELSLVGLAKLRNELERIAATGERIPDALTRFRVPTLPIGQAPLSSLLSGGVGVGQAPPDTRLPIGFDLSFMGLKPFKPGPITLGAAPPDTSFRKAFDGMLSLLPSSLMSAFTGGGSIGRTIGGLFGGGIGSFFAGTSKDGLFSGGLGKMLQGSFLGNKLGGMIAGFLPGIGTLLGPLLGKAFGAIANLGKNTTKQGREAFAKDMGFENLDNLYAKLRSLGAEGEKLANTGLNLIGKKDEASNRRWMADVTKFFDRLEKVPGKVSELTSALGKFGGAVPKALDPLLDSILGSSNLSGDLRKQLEGMRKPTWQAAADLAASFGINTGALGSGFNTARLAESAFELKRALDVFEKLEGSDQTAILRDMADEFSALAGEAKRNNVALPKAVQQFIQQVDNMGLLLDENGERIDSSLLSFADIEDEYQKQVVSLLEEIRDLLSGKMPTGAGSYAGGGIVPHVGAARDPFQMPSFAGGTHGQFMDFGAGTPVMLHGHERVMTAAEIGPMVVNVSALDVRSFENWLRSGASRAVLRTLPDAVRKAALNR